MFTSFAACCCTVFFSISLCEMNGRSKLECWLFYVSNFECGGRCMCAVYASIFGNNILQRLHFVHFHTVVFTSRQSCKCRDYMTFQYFIPHDLLLLLLLIPYNLVNTYLLYLHVHTRTHSSIQTHYTLFQT